MLEYKVKGFSKSSLLHYVSLQHEPQNPSHLTEAATTYTCTFATLWGERHSDEAGSSVMPLDFHPLGLPTQASLSFSTQ